MSWTPINAPRTLPETPSESRTDGLLLRQVEPQNATHGEWRAMKLIALLVVATALAILGAQNTQTVTFRFFMWDVTNVPVVAALFFAVLVGAIMGWAMSAPGRVRGMLNRRHLQQEVATAHDREAAAVSQMEGSRRQAGRIQEELEAERRSTTTQGDRPGE